jgi:crotonobetainyl-CoA:carnitine CoA-transferase CaiB-like acyl-CoA transferase
MTNGARWRQIAEHGEWLDDRRFDTLGHWLQFQDSLDAAIEAWTLTQDRHDCMMKLQNAGVPAGVCQNAEDRVDADPQLRHLKWLTEVTGTRSALGRSTSCR